MADITNARNLRLLNHYMRPLGNHLQDFEVLAKRAIFEFQDQDVGIPQNDDVLRDGRSENEGMPEVTASELRQFKSVLDDLVVVLDLLNVMKKVRRLTTKGPL